MFNYLLPKLKRWLVQYLSGLEFNFRFNFFFKTKVQIFSYFNISMDYYFLVALLLSPNQEVMLKLDKYFLSWPRNQQIMGILFRSGARAMVLNCWRCYPAETTPDSHIVNLRTWQILCISFIITGNKAKYLDR